MEQLQVPPMPLRSILRQMLNRRDVESQIFDAFLLLTGSGTGGLEAAVVNMLSPENKVLAINIGAGFKG